MGFYPRLARSFGLVLLVASGGVQAAEVMRMPFDCRFDGARVHLRPSADRSYAVIGRREREVFTTCSPLDPDRCSSWLVHRFDFDCNGDRVAWIDAAAAATRFADWDAWVEDGRFSMRMDRMWGVARALPFRERRRPMRRRYFDDEPDPFGPGDGGYGPRVVSVPAGFAPGVGIPLTFEGGPEMAAAPEASEWVQEAPAIAGYESRPAPAPNLPEPAPPQERRAMAPPPVVAPAPQPAAPSPPPAREEPPAAAPEPQSAEAEAPAPPVDSASELSQGTAVINGSRTVVAQPASPRMPATTSSQSEIAAARIENSTVEAPSSLRAQPTPAPSEATKTADAPPPPAPVESAAPPRVAMPALSAEAIAAIAATTLALGGLAAFGFVSWRGRSQKALPGRRDIGDISLGGGLKGLTHERAAATPAAAASPAGPEATEGTDPLPIPVTYDEALGVLGASPGASNAAIKKIVDGLRQSWHPDHARSESDRLHREARLRQINVAWDLVSRRSSAA